MYDEDTKRIDFNAHILISSFDAIKTPVQSFHLLEKLCSIGFSQILATPRFLRKPENATSVNSLKKQVEELSIAAKYHGLDVSVHLANEIFICPNLISLVGSNKVATLGKNHILIRLPLSENIPFEKIEPILIALVRRGITPIIASPERCPFFQKDPKKIDRLIECGVMVQCAYGSPIGLYGRPAAKLFGYILMNGFCDFLGTETSSETDKILEVFPRAERRIEKMIGKDSYKKILKNATGVL